MKKTAYQKAYDGAYKLTMKKLAAGDWAMPQNQFVEDYHNQELRRADQLRHQESLTRNAANVTTPVATGETIKPQAPAPGAPSPTSTPVNAGEATNVASNVEKGIESAEKAGVNAAENVGKTVSKVPKKGMFSGLGGKLKLLGAISTVALPVASHLFGNQPTPEEQGYAPDRYF